MPRGVSSAFVSGTSPWESPVEELWNTNQIPASWNNRSMFRRQMSRPGWGWYREARLNVTD